MTWIFESCSDIYGDCIRQYVIFSLSVIVLILALYSCIKTYYLQNKITFELLPLMINSMTSLMQAALYSQMQIYNTRLVLLIVEIYSYFLISYGFIITVISSQTGLKSKIKFFDIIFRVVSILSILVIILLIVLSVTDVIECQQDQGIGSIILISIQMVLILVTFIYCSQYERIIRQSNKQNPVQVNASSRLLNVEDQYIKLKIIQLNLVRFAFIVTFFLHLAQILCFYIADQQFICVNGKLLVENNVQLGILLLQNISELFPHFIIPFIFWYLPNRITGSSKSASDWTFEEPQKIQQQKAQKKHKNKIAIRKNSSNLVSDIASQEKLQNIRKRSLKRFSKMSKLLGIDQ